jgi:integral membrane sensor domain MASE1
MAKKLSTSKKPKFSIASAIALARKSAGIGPRVSAILSMGDTLLVADGFMDTDTDDLKQIVLVTPDGRLWVPMSEAAVRKVHTCK